MSVTHWESYKPASGSQTVGRDNYTALQSQSAVTTYFVKN